MSLSSLIVSRNRLLASAAVVALVVGAAAPYAFSGAGQARAAAVDTSGLQAQAAPSFAPLIARVKPAVVSVKVKIAPTANEGGSGMENVPPEMRRFFRQFGWPGGDGEGFGPPRSVVTGEGSGFFISADGYIVTNNHVVANARTVEVTTDDGKTLEAKVIGTDPKTDVALIKVAQSGDFPYVAFAKQAPRVGDWVVAIGNPYGLGGTVTAGIVSAEGRDIGEGAYDRFLQIDAPINKGNSGGPTFDAEGHVVGVNTAIYSPSGGSVGIGFAIPAGTVESVVDALEHGGSVQRGRLGVAIQPVTQDIADSLGLKEARGALVAKTEPGTPAAAIGLKSGDVIVSVNGTPISDAADLTRRIGAMKPGEKATLSYIRDGAQLSAEATLAAQEPDKVAAAASEASPSRPSELLGARLAAANTVSGAGDKGVVLTQVDPNGAAAEKGLRQGDVILEVAGKPVSTPADVRTALGAAQKEGRKAALMRVQTSDGDRFVAFEFPKA